MTLGLKFSKKSRAYSRPSMLTVAVDPIISAVIIITGIVALVNIHIAKDGSVGICGVSVSPKLGRLRPLVRNPDTQGNGRNPRVNQ